MFKRNKTDNDEPKSQWQDVEPFFDGAASGSGSEEDSPDGVDSIADDDTFAGFDTFVESDDDVLDSDEAFADDDEFLDGEGDPVFAADVPVGEESDDEPVDDAIEGSAESTQDDEKEAPTPTIPAAAVPVSSAAVPTAADSTAAATSAPLVQSSVKGMGRHGKHGQVKAGSDKAFTEDLPEHQRKAHRTRRMLIIVIILLIALIGALVYFGYQLIDTSHEVASQQTNQSTSDVNAASTSSTGTKDASTTTTKKTTVPSLTSVIGKAQADAIKALGHGATVSLSSDVNEEGNPMKKRVTVVLTDEPADTKSGTPTVYLGLNDAGQVIMAGYSAATASLGYGSLSFADAVSNEHIIEKTLNEAGLNLSENTVTLPAKSTYSTYGSDGTTLVKESCSFNGSTTMGASNYTWSAVLVYDYTAANASGNLADTVRQIYIYVNAA